MSTFHHGELVKLKDKAIEELAPYAEEIAKIVLQEFRDAATQGHSTATIHYDDIAFWPIRFQMWWNKKNFCNAFQFSILYLGPKFSFIGYGRDRITANW